MPPAAMTIIVLIGAIWGIMYLVDIEFRAFGWIQAALLERNSGKRK